MDLAKKLGIIIGIAFLLVGGWLSWPYVAGFSSVAFINMAGYFLVIFGMITLLVTFLSKK